MSENVEILELPQRRPLNRQVVQRMGRAENIVQLSNIPEITDRLVNTAFEFCRETGRPVSIRGATITYTDEQKGRLRPSHIREFTIQMPDIQIGGQ